MIQKLGAAMKKMAQRSMMRGNRGDAQAITDFGVTGMRSNLQNQPQNVITQKVGNVNVESHDIFTKETTDSLKASLENKTANSTASHAHHTDTQPAKKLGNSILDALQ